MTKPLGVIAEDVSDVEVVREIANKIVRGSSIPVRYFVGHGCGKVKSKCAQWAANLNARGCASVVVIHDLDSRQLQALRDELCQALYPCPIPASVIVIPVRTIEAWLLSDEEAIRRAMRLQTTPNPVPNPEALLHPKRTLEDLVYSRSRKTKRYVHTVHNAKVASELRIGRLRRCASFRPLERFLHDNFDNQ